jgi:hypothetical protein
MDALELASLSVSPRLHQQLGQNRTAIMDHDEEGMPMRGKTVRYKLTIEKRSYNLWFYFLPIGTVVDLGSLSMGTDDYLLGYLVGHPCTFHGVP